MGLKGAMSLMEEDQQRFGQPWTCNWEDEGGDGGNASKKHIVLLVDGISMMHHVAANQEESETSPAIIRSKVESFITKLLKALPEQSELRIFLDGLAPTAKLNTQIETLKQQAIDGDNLAKLQKDAPGSTNKKAPQLLHLLAEWALVEAVQGLCTEDGKGKWGGNKILELHRPSRGEAAAYIDHWIARKLTNNAEVCVLADDTDYLVYQHCPGFISFGSLVMQEENDEVRLSGFEYQRNKFLEAFLPSGVNKDDAMTVVAALVGCDYSLHSEAQKRLGKALNTIVESNIGGLIGKARKNPSKAPHRLEAVLRYVAHFMNRERDNWVEALCAKATASTENVNWDNSKEKEEHEQRLASMRRAATILKEAFLTVHKTYFRSLTLPNNPSFEIKPTSMEVRRLLEYGMFFCRPIVETWTPSSYDYSFTSRKRSIEEVNSALDSGCFAVVLSPPFTRQVAGWMAEDSVWRVPHFYQARMRLYCALVQFARTGGAYSFEGGQLRLSPMWTNDDPKVTEYVRTNSVVENDSNGASSLRMQERDVRIPTFDCISAGWGDETELLSGEDALDRACLFCVLGNAKQAKPALNACLRGSGTLFLATIFLPFNLSLLLILVGTSPEIEKVASMEVKDSARIETVRVLPLLSVACYHAIFISDTLVSLFGTHSEEHKQSNLTFSPTDGRSRHFEVGEVLELEKAVWVWNAVRLGADLELSHTEDGDDASEVEIAMDYLDQAIDRLARQLPQTSEWGAKIKDWKYRAKVLWVIWWEVFNVDSSTNATVETSTKELNEWDKYILLLSKR